jgi:hypothetical protein
MKSITKIILLVILAAFPVLAQQSTLKDSLLDCMTGDWVLRGKIGGKETVYDIKANWVLAHQYILIHEISRDKDTLGQPEYEANLYIGWDYEAKEYVCILIDIGGVITAQSIGRAKPNGNEITFLFRDKKDKVYFHTTLIYDKDTNTWRWQMDIDHNGKLMPFARVKLTRE